MGSGKHSNCHQRDATRDTEGEGHCLNLGQGLHGGDEGLQGREEAMGSRSCRPGVPWFPRKRLAVGPAHLRDGGKPPGAAVLSSELEADSSFED